MSAPKLSVPAGTVISLEFRRVTLEFFSEREAEQFCEWLQWIDQQPTGKELVITSLKGPTQ
jgi:hypothetical protein